MRKVQATWSDATFSRRIAVERREALAAGVATVGRPVAVLRCDQQASEGAEEAHNDSESVHSVTFNLLHIRRERVTVLPIPRTRVCWSDIDCPEAWPARRDAAELEYKAIMISDALAGHAHGLHEATLATFYRIFGDVRPSSEIIQLLHAVKVT